MITGMVVVGLLAHGEPPRTVPDLDGIAHLTIATNGRSDPEPTPWLGFGANHNRLMDKHHEAEWYVALNADVNLSAQQLHTLIEQASAQGYALVAPLRREPWGIQGGPTEALPSPGNFLKDSFWPLRPRGRRDPAIGSSGSMADAAWVGGCCMVIRGDLMRELHFDERYFMYFEDVDISQRASELGARVGVCTSVTIDHSTGWRHNDPLIGRRGVEYARSAISYAEAHGHSPRIMRMAAFAWATALTVAPGRERSARAASKAIARGLSSPAMPGLAECAQAHNQRYGFRPS